MKLKDWLILFIPVIVIALIMLLPFIPDKIPMQYNIKGEVNWYLSKWLFPIIGVIPFAIYKKNSKK